MDWLYHLLSILGEKGFIALVIQILECGNELEVREKNVFFIDWQKQYEDQLIADHENVKWVGENELPF